MLKKTLAHLLPCLPGYFVMALIVALMFAAPSIARAQVKFGQSLDLTGVTAPFSRDYIRGFNANFAAINKTGGIAGKQVELITLDDAFQPKKTLENTLKLIADPAVISLMGYRGTQNIQAILQTLESERIALVGTPAGAEPLRASPWIFHNRASLSDEVDALIKLAATVGQKRIAIGYQDDAFGLDGLSAFESAMARRNITPVAYGPIPRGTVDVKHAASMITKGDPWLVVIVGQSKPAAALMLEIQALGKRPVFALTSVASGIHEELKEQAHGAIVSQVVPSPFRGDVSKLVSAYQRDMRANGELVYSNNSLEGYLVAEIALRALRSAGNNPSRSSFVRALETMPPMIFDALKVGYSPQNRNGTRFIETTMVRKDGSLAR
jgi:branched-chain amino acid transport system substrate-binding protein